MIQTERIKILKKIVEQNPKDSLALYALGLEYKSMEEFDTAVDFFDRLLKIDPDYVPGYYQKALVHLQQGRTKDAVKVLKAGIPKAAEAGHLHARDKMRELLESLK